MDKELFCILTNLEEKELDYYVEKGLISANYKDKEFTFTQSDDEDNTFTNENRTEANIIKILEYLEFNIDEMVELKFTNYVDLKHALEQKMLTYTDDTYDLKKKKEVIEVLKVSGFEKKVLDCYADGICKNKKGKIENTESIFSSIGQAITLSVISILLSMLIIMVVTQEGISSIEMKKELLGLMVMTIPTAIASIFSWKKYITNYKIYKNAQKSIDKKGFKSIPIIIFYIICGICMYIVFYWFPSFIVSSSSYMYQIDYRAEIAFVIGIAIWAFAVRCDIEKRGNIASILKRILITIRLCVVGIVVAILLSLNFTLVTKDKIIMHSTFNIKGIEYNYDDVDSVNASFGKKKVAIIQWKRKGNFSYIVTIDDKKIVFKDPMENDYIKRYEDLEYVALEDFDAKLMELGVPKTSDDKYSKYCDEIDSIVERYVRIVNNK